MGWANACHPICHAGNPLKIPIHTSDAPVIEKVDLVVRAKETPEKPSKSVSYREHKYAPISLGDHETEAGSWA